MLFEDIEELIHTILHNGWSKRDRNLRSAWRVGCRSFEERPFLRGIAEGTAGGWCGCQNSGLKLRLMCLNLILGTVIARIHSYR